MTRTKALEFARRRENNLRFFRQFYPDIYQYFMTTTLTRAEVVISNQEDEVDLQLDGQSLYEGQGRARGHQGVQLFKSTFSEGKILPSLPPPWPGEYRHPRFAHRAVDRIIRESPLKRQDFTGFPIPNFYPLVVFQGVGLGFQIEELVTTAEVENAIILEPELEIFGASLLTVDWEKVCSRFQRNGRSLRFLLGVKRTEEDVWPALVKHLMHFTPIFPVMNLFLNERGDPVMDAVAKRINREAIPTLSTWGHYDDEIRQLNNALHAFHEGIRTIPDRGTVTSDVPTLIVGSGPSLDNRIEDIRESRDQVVLVSAGTGLRVLIENDIYPDFHVELESDYLNYRVISSYDREKLKSVRIIAASQVCPLMWGLFGEQRLYFKKENPISAMFGSPQKTIAGVAPTCTNAAIALCTQLGLSNIFLFGTDYGFKDHSKHHSSRSVYMESKDEVIGTELQESASKAFDKSRTFTVKGTGDSVVHTTPIYFTAKRAVENLINAIQSGNSDYAFSNCSDGAEIEGASWTDRSEFAKFVQDAGSSSDKSRVISLLFDDDASQISLENIRQALADTEQKLERLAAKISDMTSKRRLRGKKDITQFCSEMSRYLEGDLFNSDPGFYFMIRGAVRHFLYAGFAHAMALSDNKEIEMYLNKWKNSFASCMGELPQHFRSVTQKSYHMESDPWVRQSIDDPELPIELKTV